MKHTRIIMTLLALMLVLLVPVSALTLETAGTADDAAEVSAASLSATDRVYIAAGGQYTLPAGASVDVGTTEATVNGTTLAGAGYAGTVTVTSGNDVTEVVLVGPTKFKPGLNIFTGSADPLTAADYTAEAFALTFANDRTTSVVGTDGDAAVFVVNPPASGTSYPRTYMVNNFNPVWEVDRPFCVTFDYKGKDSWLMVNTRSSADIVESMPASADSYSTFSYYGVSNRANAPHDPTTVSNFGIEQNAIAAGTPFYFNNFSVIPAYHVNYINEDGGALYDEWILTDDNGDLLTSFIPTVPEGSAGYIDGVVYDADNPYPLANADITVTVGISPTAIRFSADGVFVTAEVEDMMYALPTPEELNVSIPHFRCWIDENGNYVDAGTEYFYLDVQGKSFTAFVQDETQPAMGYAFEGAETGNFNWSPVSVSNYSSGGSTAYAADADGRSVYRFSQASLGQNDVRFTLPFASAVDQSEYYLLDMGLNWKAEGGDNTARTARIYYQALAGANCVWDTMNGTVNANGGMTYLSVNLKDLAAAFGRNYRFTKDSSWNFASLWLDPFTSLNEGGANTNADRGLSVVGDIDYVRVYRAGNTTVTYKDGDTVLFTETGRGVGTGYLLSGNYPVKANKAFAGWTDENGVVYPAGSVDLTGDLTVYASYVDTGVLFTSPDGTVAAVNPDTATMTVPTPAELGLSIPHFVVWIGPDGEKLHVGDTVTVADYFNKFITAYTQDASKPAMGFAFEGATGAANNVNFASHTTGSGYSETTDDEGRSVLRYQTSSLSAHDLRFQFLPTPNTVNAAEYYQAELLMNYTVENYGGQNHYVTFFYNPTTGIANPAVHQRNYTEAPYKANAGDVDVRWDWKTISQASYSDYVFGKNDWYVNGLWLDPVRDGANYDKGKPVTIDIVSYRLYRAGITTVTYMNGDEVFSTDEDRGVGIGYLLSAKHPTKDGYRFMGWADANGALYENGKVDLTDDLTVYALFVEEGITFVDGAGAHVTVSPDGDTYTVPAPASLGLDETNFVAWIDANGNKINVGDSVNVADLYNTTVTAYTQDASKPAMGFAVEGNGKNFNTTFSISAFNIKEFITDAYGRNYLHVGSDDSAGTADDGRFQITLTDPVSAREYTMLEIVRKNNSLGSATSARTRLFYLVNGAYSCAEDGTHTVPNRTATAGETEYVVYDLKSLTASKSVHAFGSDAVADWNVSGIWYDIAQINPKNDHADIDFAFIRLYRAGITEVKYYDGETLLKTETGRGVGTGYLLDWTVAPVKDGLVFKGWADEDGNLYEDGKLDLVGDTAVYAVYEEPFDYAPTHDTGAVSYTFKTLSGKRTAGIRFVASVNALQRADASEYGFIVSRKTLLGDTELTFDSEKYVFGKAYDKAAGIDLQSGVSDEGDVTFGGFVYNIPADKEADLLVARPYLKANGATFYGAPLETSVSDVILD